MRNLKDEKHIQNLPQPLPDSYPFSIEFHPEQLHKILEVIVNSIRTRVEKASLNGGVVALSGGIDSSLVATLSSLALGKKLLLLLMPEKGITPDKDTQDALSLARRLKADCAVIPINSLIEEFIKIQPRLTHRGNRIAYANIKPRIRMIIGYIYANLRNALFIGTSNKSELLLGYGTKYGDMGADIYPIGDLYKTQVWQLADFMGIPTAIIQKAPSPGLWKGQTTEAELGHTYRLIDHILYALVDMEFSPVIASAYLHVPLRVVEEIHQRVIKNEHKRKSPTITRISPMCLDKDWRYPIERY